MYTRILLPTDGSPRSLAAAVFARDLLRLNPSARLTILHVRQQQPRAYRVYRGAEVEVQPSEEEMRRICEAEERFLSPTEAIFASAGLATDTEVLPGRPLEVILSYAERGGFDLIVMGRRKSGRIKGFFTARMTDQVVQTARCPVVIVKD